MLALGTGVQSPAGRLQAHWGAAVCRAVAARPSGPGLAGLQLAKAYLHELQSGGDCSMEMSSGRCFYFYYTQFTFGRLSLQSGNPEMHYNPNI